MPSSIPSPARRIGTTSGRGSPILTPVVRVTGVSISMGETRHVARRLVGEQRDELLGQLAEDRRRRAGVAEHRELVGDERVVGDVQAHTLRLVRRPQRTVSECGSASPFDSPGVRA